MLKLALKPGEALKIGDDVKIKVTLSTYNRIQFEIDAPKEINIKREKEENPKDEIKKSRIIIVRGSEGE